MANNLPPRAVDLAGLPTSISTPPMAFASFREAALFWFGFGFHVIPIVPGTKRPATKWDPWLHDLSGAKISAYWRQHPAHEVGFIVGAGYIVFDADSRQSVAALQAMEQQFGVEPMLVVQTKRGEHHYYRRDAGTMATTVAFSTDAFPDRVDVKTGRTIVILPPSTGKVIVKMGVTQ